MNILGFHGSLYREDEQHPVGFGAHDAAAILLRDGVLVAAIEEERLNRLKHSNTFPHRAIQSCLERGGLSWENIDCIATNRSQSALDRSALMQSLADPSLSGIRDARSLLNDCFVRAFDVDVSAKLRFCPHHIAHAWSAFGPSGFEEALILVVDGDGDDLSGLVLLGRGRELITLREFPISKSLGQLYTRMISFIGFGRFDEYKAMGLAPYGDPTVYQHVFEQSTRLLPEGDYDLDPQEHWVARLQASGLIGHARRKGQPFTQVHMDLAAALQKAVERIILHVLTHYQNETGQRSLCLAGGVAHNCSANGAVLYSGLFDRVFVQPAAHDAGGALGAAIHAAHQQGEAGRDSSFHVYLGTHLGEGRDVCRSLEAWRDLVDVEHIGDASEAPAQLLATGSVIGWAQGRSEFGPRALGNRSILADPRPAENKGRINAMVKKREAFRPFAPAVLAERVHDYFEVPVSQTEFPFMIFVLKVKAEAQQRLGAITHVDGTARVQTVSREDNPRFWSLIRAFERETGVGMLLNTSFNNNAEPIIDSVDDAVACFLTTGLDALVVGDWLVRKKPSELPARYGALVPDVPPFRRLVRRRRLDPTTGRFLSTDVLESTRSRYFGPVETPISSHLADALRLADGPTLAEACELADIPDGSRDAVFAEAARLWADRVIILRPAR